VSRASTIGAAMASLMAGFDGWRSAFDDERVVLSRGSSSSIYGGAGPPPLRQRHGPPPLWWHGCSVLVGTVARKCGRCDLEGGPLLRTTQASVIAGGVLHPRQLWVASSFLGYDGRRPNLEQQAAPYTWADRRQRA
jgi:hypothetical protein